jgi:hypothetical protein
MSNLRKYISILIILITILNCAGFVFIFYIQQKLLKHEMFELISRGEFKSELIVFKVSKHNMLYNSLPINWKEENEFEYNGKMFDIVKTETMHDTIIYHCVNDDKEGKLIKEFKKFVTEHGNKKTHHSKTNNSLVSVIIPGFIKNKYLLKLDVSFFYLNIQSSFGYKSFINETPTPPPKII